MSHWESLFDQAVSIINQANTSFKLLDSWTFGGGTALMLQINHRESFDIDIFIDDPQVLPYLNPKTQGYTLQVNPDEYVSDGTHALKIAVLKTVGRATSLPSRATRWRWLHSGRSSLDPPL